MPFIWVAIDDDRGPYSLRGYIEGNSIALLSNYRKPALDPPSRHWLGRHCGQKEISEGGLWNSNQMDEPYDPGFLDILDRFVCLRERGL
jgi:hypothetical protein